MIRQAVLNGRAKGARESAWKGVSAGEGADVRGGVSETRRQLGITCQVNYCTQGFRGQVIEPRNGNPDQDGSSLTCGKL